MQKPILIFVAVLLSGVVIVACDDSPPAPEVREVTPPAPTKKHDAPAKVVDSKPADVKAPAAKDPTATPPAATKPDASAPAVATDTAPAVTQPKTPKSPKNPKKPAVAKTAEPEPAPTAEPVVEPAPASDVPPELQKYAALAATPKFREFTALAAERHTLQLRASQLRLEMRGVVPPEAQQTAVAAVQIAIGKVGDRMDSYVTGKTWTQDELITMDFIVSEQMRLRPPPG